MAIIKPLQRNVISPSLLPVTAYGLYLERVKSISEGLRAAALGKEYIPLQFGGILGQQQALASNEIVSIIDFDTDGN
jgi:hypothetical protein